MMTGRTLAIKLAAFFLLATHAWAGEDSTLLSEEGARVTLGVRQPETEPAADDAGFDEVALSSRYGTEGTEWIIYGGGAAYDFSNNTDAALSIAYSNFLIDDVEWVLELAGWYHSQEGDDAVSLNPAMEFRWHFYNDGDTSVFLNTGIGVLVSSDTVPDTGTGFNFTPRAGIGVTQRISDDGARLIAGLRWHHISNARIAGEVDNPARDAPMLYLQLAVPF